MNNLQHILSQVEHMLATVLPVVWQPAAPGYHPQQAQAMLSRNTHRPLCGNAYGERTGRFGSGLSARENSDISEISAKPSPSA